MSNLIIITGAAGTIGQETAQLLSRKGYELLLIDKNADKLAPLVNQLPDCKWLKLDVTDAKLLANAFDDVADKLYGVVLAAGIKGPIDRIENCHDDEFNHLMNTNVNSVWLGIKHGLRILKPKKRGTIIALSSISGVMGMPMLAPYCMSKHAVQGLVKTAAREAAASGVRINAVAPGPVASEMMMNIDNALSRIKPGHTTSQSNIPMERYAEPIDVAQMISFLCSEESAYCTGMTMMVDGGLTCR